MPWNLLVKYAYDQLHIQLSILVFPRHQNNSTLPSAALLKHARNGCHLQSKTQLAIMLQNGMKCSQEAGSHRTVKDL